MVKKIINGRVYHLVPANLQSSYPYWRKNRGRSKFRKNRRISYSATRRTDRYGQFI